MKTIVPCFVLVMIALCCVMLLSGCSTIGRPGESMQPGKKGVPEQWRGVHFLSPGKSGLPMLERAISDSLAPMGVNVIILEHFGIEIVPVDRYETRNTVIRIAWYAAVAEP